ncbi:hypothetical protein CDAR_241021 [Caerostris darwini]|uniref:Uncharacterized protein n=1 Tax=Caerostris darwini TaxID=1538125 RepID=A0AAV4THG0_9ARAC|nr:hypothetical protein CDAR_241021 [Caerostris darwini]
MRPEETTRGKLQRPRHLPGPLDMFEFRTRGTFSPGNQSPLREINWKTPNAMHTHAPQRNSGVCAPRNKKRKTVYIHKIN